MYFDGNFDYFEIMTIFNVLMLLYIKQAERYMSIDL